MLLLVVLLTDKTCVFLNVNGSHLFVYRILRVIFVFRQILLNNVVDVHEDGNVRIFLQCICIFSNNKQRLFKSNWIMKTIKR